MSTLILLVLKWLGGLTSAQWARAIQLVVYAAQTNWGSTGKRAWVVETLNSEEVKGWVANLLTELAHGFAKRKGLIS
jgi:hypothetical protein